MDSDARNRVTGTSDHKKRKFGRKRKLKLNNKNARGLFVRKNQSNIQSTVIDEVGPSASTSSSSRIDSVTSTNISENTQPLPPVSRSHQKLKKSTVKASNVRNRIVDISILFPQLQDLLVCKKCYGTVKFSEVDIRGLGSKISVSCTACYKTDFIEASAKTGRTSNAYAVNKSSLLAARMLGHGIAGLKTFCGIMDLPSPVSHSNFDIINSELRDLSGQVAKKSMKTAALEQLDNQTSEELNVSGDGSWRKRGFSSLQGFSSLIRYDSAKVIDVAAKQSFCRACELHPKEDSESYHEWWNQHKLVCSINHTGSSGKMEVNGIVEMFQRSELQYGIKYKNYIGDGDSKVYKSVCEANPYGDDYQVMKKECVGHVQKRMGTRLRNFKASYAGKLCSDGKSIGGRGRLTAQVIDELTRYYGNAIRKHKDSSDEMSQAIWATFYHKSSTDKNPQHDLCPPGIQSWCKWQKAKATSKKALRNFKHTNSIPPAIMELIKPIFTDLTEKELLEKCVGGFTQNSNESFNQSVWRLIPKNFFSGLAVLEIGINLAVICFNDGRTALLEVMEKLGIEPGVSAIQWAKSIDEERLIHADIKARESTLEARRAKRKRTHAEDDCYVAGGH